jgi:uncharacterized iron-regulated membrane protein
METDLRSATIVDAQPAVSWGAVAAGAVAAAALTLLLVAFGAGMGFSAVSPWSDSGVSTSTFSIATGIYLVLIGVMSSAVGGYIAGRLRSKWVGIHTNEVFFRDTAHGFLAWAFATLISATALASTTTYLANGAGAGLAGATGQAARAANPADIYVDKLFRAPPIASASAAENAANGNNAAAGNANAAPTAGGNAQLRSEIVRLWTADFRENDDLSSADRAYVAQMVAARTGMTQADADKRVDDVVAEAKSAIDKARRAAAKLSFWLAAALLFGAFAASLTGAEGGALRDGTWNDRVLIPRNV